MMYMKLVLRKYPTLIGPLKRGRNAFRPLKRRDVIGSFEKWHSVIGQLGKLCTLVGLIGNGAL